MKNRNSIVVLTGRNLLLACQLFPPQPQTQPTTHARHTIRYRWLFLLLAVLSLCAISRAQVGLPSVPPLGIAQEYRMNIMAGDDVVANTCYAWAHGYNVESLCDAAENISYPRCAELTYPLPHAYAPVEFYTADDCRQAQFQYFEVYQGSKAECKQQVDSWLTDIKNGNGALCSATERQNPTIGSPYVVPFMDN